MVIVDWRLAVNNADPQVYHTMMIRKLIFVLAIGISLVVIGAKSKDDDSKVHRVTIKNLKYDPATLTIKPGETVVWTNLDDNDHTVIADDKDTKGNPVFASDNLGSGEKFQFTFAKKGKFPYHCKYHPRMKGVVIVAD